ncbi:unnamed protein product [Triticum turgidum subsp. durum]|uniref:Cytochrome P450 n=1 Tax=Triticum turgidum subsp. durum TaxID=4567 RepID=A0A9R1R0Y1_TRITD|nr:unnamed protein product [Triticum turgidum subsp. durum]
MEFVMLLAVLLCLLAGMVILRSYTRRAHAQATIYHVGDPAVAHRALIGNADDFLNRPAASFPTSLATWRHGERNDNIATVSYGPQWRVLRCNLTAEILSRLGSLAPLHEEVAQALVADLSARCGGGGDVAVREPITKAVFTLVTRLCFGDIVDDSQRHAIGRVIRDSIVAAGKLSPGFDGSMLSKLANWRGFRRISAVLKRQPKLYLPLIAARSQSQSQLCGGIVHPYVDSLLDLRVPEDNGDASGPGRPLRDGELVGLVFEFLGAATGSTAACLEWTLAHLIDQPETLDKLRVEIDEEADAGGILSSKSLRGGMPYLNAVVLECLRMHPPVPIGRDAKRWTDPDKFRPERFLAGGEAEDIGPAPGPKEIRMMPFGAGHRHCPGVNMGMLHIKCFLAALVHNFDWALSAEDCSSGVDMTEQDGFIKIMKKPLSARVTRRT